jgi:hypothetical protein
MRNLFNRDPRLLDTLYALGIQGGDPAVGTGDGLELPPRPPNPNPGFTLPLTPYGGGTPTQVLGGAGGLRTQPGTAAPGGAGGISLNQGAPSLPTVNPPNGGMGLGDIRNWLQSYRQRRFGNPTTAPVGPAKPPIPVNIRLGHGVY